jgi:flavodoxin/NAD-dependent dihydropyrimidine dehydrogenase PreA subunit
MDICIFYFSGTGNTKWVADRLAGELAVRGREAHCHSVEQLDENETRILINKTDTVIFGYPIYGSSIPEPMLHFIDNLPKVSKTKRAGLFCTQMAFSGDGAWYYHKTVENKGFEIKWTHHFKMPSNICMKVWPLPYTADPAKIKKILDKCLVKVKKAAEKIAEGAPSYTGNGVLSLLLGLMQRPIYRRLIRKPFKSPYEVEPGKCTKCMRCIQICPAGNIRLTDEEISFGTECVLCMRCYNFCPVNAIKAYGKSHDPKKKPYRGPDEFDPALITNRKNLMDFIE